MEQRDTSWTLIQAARADASGARDAFALAYAPIVRSALQARWRSSPLESEVDDAVQEVLLACVGDGDTLGRSDPNRPFRPFLLGIARTIARRFEGQRGRGSGEPLDEDALQARETRLSVAYDRTFALEVLREANELHQRTARAAGGVKARRVELLEMRFQRGLSIAQIAAAWAEDADKVHHMYAHAREDFRCALREVVARRSSVAAADLERECDWMLDALRRGGG